MPITGAIPIAGTMLIAGAMPIACTMSIAGVAIASAQTTGVQMADCMPLCYYFWSTMHQDGPQLVLVHRERKKGWLVMSLENSDKHRCKRRAFAGNVPAADSQQQSLIRTPRSDPWLKRFQARPPEETTTGQREQRN